MGHVDPFGPDRNELCRIEEEVCIHCSFAVAYSILYGPPSTLAKDRCRRSGPRRSSLLHELLLAREGEGCDWQLGTLERFLPFETDPNLVK
jgi:hypothetical protein